MFWGKDGLWGQTYLEGVWEGFLEEVTLERAWLDQCGWQIQKKGCQKSTVDTYAVDCDPHVGVSSAVTPGTYFCGRLQMLCGKGVPCRISLRHASP